MLGQKKSPAKLNRGSLVPSNSGLGKFAQDPKSTQRFLKWMSAGINGVPQWGGGEGTTPENISWHGRPSSTFRSGKSTNHLCPTSWRSSSPRSQIIPSTYHLYPYPQSSHLHRITISASRCRAISPKDSYAFQDAHENTPTLLTWTAFISQPRCSYQFFLAKEPRAGTYDFVGTLNRSSWGEGDKDCSSPDLN